MIILVASALIALLVFFALHSFIQTKLVPKTQIHQRLKKLKYGSQGQTERAASKNLADIPFVERTINPMIETIKETLMLLAPKSVHEQLEKRILLSGKQDVWSVTSLASGWVISVGVFLFLTYTFLAMTQLPFIQKCALLLVGGGLGALVPLAILNSIIRKRQKAILKQLPEFLDLLCVSVQAGLSFDSGVAKIVSRMKGPFIEECQRMQRDVRMGMMRRHAMQQMARRCDVLEVYLFTTSIIQTERLGTSISSTLMSQADNMRERRRQEAKAEALRAPIKILFPLALFILPALFVVVLLPSILLFMEQQP